MNIQKMKEFLVIAKKYMPPIVGNEYIDEAIAELENPMNGDAMDVADRIREICFDETMGYDSFMAESLIKDFAESYHAKKCAECQKAKDSL